MVDDSNLGAYLSRRDAGRRVTIPRARLEALQVGGVSSRLRFSVEAGARRRWLTAMTSSISLRFLPAAWTGRALLGEPLPPSVPCTIQGIVQLDPSGEPYLQLGYLSRFWPVES